MDTATATPTRLVVISTRKAANLGRAYLDTFLGLTVVERTWEGTEFTGTVTSFVGEHAVITAPDGRWMRAASTRLAVAL